MQNHLNPPATLNQKSTILEYLKKDEIFNNWFHLDNAWDVISTHLRTNKQYKFLMALILKSKRRELADVLKDWGLQQK